MFGSLAPGMKMKTAKAKKPRKLKAPGMAAYAGVHQQGIVLPDTPPQTPSALGGVDDEAGADSVG